MPFRDQHFLGRFIQTFEGAFAAESIAMSEGTLTHNDGYRTMGLRVTGSFAFLMGEKPSMDILGNAAIQAVITASQEIDKPL